MLVFTSCFHLGSCICPSSQELLLTRGKLQRLEKATWRHHDTVRSDLHFLAIYYPIFCLHFLAFVDTLFMAWNLWQQSSFTWSKYAFLSILLNLLQVKWYMEACGGEFTAHITNLLEPVRWILSKLISIFQNLTTLTVDLYIADKKL